jgi:hypothetical protein
MATLSAKLCAVAQDYIPKYGYSLDRIRSHLSPVIHGLLGLISYNRTYWFVHGVHTTARAPAQY